MATEHATMGTERATMATECATMGTEHATTASHHHQHGCRARRGLAWLPAHRRSNARHAMSHKARTTSWRLIFDCPIRRSTKVKGTSTKRQPTARQR